MRLNYIYLLIAACCLHNVSIAQGSKLFKDGLSWSYRYTNITYKEFEDPWVGGQFNSITESIYKLDGDTLIDSIVYLKFYAAASTETKDRYHPNKIAPYHSITCTPFTLSRFYRYDSLARSIISSKGDTVYNFNLQIGDTVRLKSRIAPYQVKAVINKIDTTEFKGIETTRFYFDMYANNGTPVPSPFAENYLIDGLGTNRGFFYIEWNKNPLDAPVQYTDLWCVDTALSCEFNCTPYTAPVGMKDIQSESFQLYPNPLSDGNVFLQGDDIEGEHYQLTQTDGRIIQSGIIDKTLSICLNDFEAGVYIFKLFKKGSTTKRIVKH